jgi:hypothetical protein
VGRVLVALLLLAITAVTTAFVVMGHAVVTTLEERDSRGQHPGTG